MVQNDVAVTVRSLKGWKYPPKNSSNDNSADNLNYSTNNVKIPSYLSFFTLDLCMSYDDRFVMNQTIIRNIRMNQRELFFSGDAFIWLLFLWEVELLMPYSSPSILHQLLKVNFRKTSTNWKSIGRRVLRRQKKYWFELLQYSTIVAQHVMQCHTYNAAAVSMHKFRHTQTHSKLL